MRTRAQFARESSPDLKTDANGSIIADTSLEELNHMDEDTMDRLLAQAKTNLHTASTKSNGIDEIKRNWNSIPKLTSGTESELLSLPKKGVVNLLKQARPSIASSSTGFRKIIDPIQARKEKQAAKDSTAGKKWFDMPKPEVTPEVKRDLQLLKMRNVLDPKRHYKKDKSPLPMYFQTGTIIEGNTEYYSARLSKKDRKKSIADEILADSAARTYFKRKYSDIQNSKLSGRKAHYKKIKDMRKKGL